MENVDVNVVCVWQIVFINNCWSTENFYVCSDTIIITFFREIVVVLLIHSRQVVEYSEISKETSELREGGRWMGWTGFSKWYWGRQGGNRVVKMKFRFGVLSVEVRKVRFAGLYLVKPMTIICRLVYRAGNICNHFFTRDFLQVRSTWKTNKWKRNICSECVLSTKSSFPTTWQRRRFLSRTSQLDKLSSRIISEHNSITFLGQANREQRDQAWEVCLWRLWVLGEVCCLGMSQVELNASVVV